MNAVAGRSSVAAAVETCRVGAFRIPTDAHESDGTLEWDATTLVVVELSAGGETGLGYTYAGAGVARAIRDELASFLVGRDAFAIDQLWAEMFARLRNHGRQGASSMAVSAVDVALWDLKAKLVGLPLVTLLGQCRDALPLYGSGGFTSYSDEQLRAQFESWAAAGIRRFKMKVGRDVAADPKRVRVAREVIGREAELFVDANSAYGRTQAREIAQHFVLEFNVRWLEQPLVPEDLDGLKFLREHVPAGLDIADGEYGYDLDYFRRLLAAGAADVVMADLTRCGGITGFMKVAVLCETAAMPLSSHCAPALHLHPGCAVRPLRHAEYFHDHARIERRYFEGAREPAHGVLAPDTGCSGHGLAFRWADAQAHAI